MKVTHRLPLVLLAAAGRVALEQDAAQEVDPESLPEPDGLETKEFRHQPVPEPHRGQSQEHCHDRDEDSHNDHAADDFRQGLHF